jgi:hypothetical protein
MRQKRLGRIFALWVLETAKKLAIGAISFQLGKRAKKTNELFFQSLKSLHHEIHVRLI